MTWDPATLEHLADLVAAAHARCGQVRVVAIDGPSGAGKTTLAAELSRLIHAPVVSMDDLFPGWDGLAAAVPLLTTSVLEPLARGEDAAYRKWDWTQNRWDATVPVPYTTLLVIEGVGSSVRPAGDYAAVRIWVDAAREVRFARGMARDGQAYRPHWERWARQEEHLFTADRTRERADVLLDTSHI